MSSGSRAAKLAGWAFKGKDSATPIKGKNYRSSFGPGYAAYAVSRHRYKPLKIIISRTPRMTTATADVSTAA